jgi:hypothetical protein
MDYSRRYYQEHKERLLANGRKYYQEHKQEIIEHNTAYYWKNPEENRAKHRAYYATNRERILEQKAVSRKKPSTIEISKNVSITFD